MKRKLATAARYHSDSFGLSHEEPAHIPAMQELTAEKIARVDPHGEKALAIMKEIDGQRKK